MGPKFNERGVLHLNLFISLPVGAFNEWLHTQLRTCTPGCPNQEFNWLKNSWISSEKNSLRVHDSFVDLSYQFAEKKREEKTIHFSHTHIRFHFCFDCFHVSRGLVFFRPKTRIFNIQTQRQLPVFESSVFPPFLFGAAFFTHAFESLTQFAGAVTGGGWSHQYQGTFKRLSQSTFESGPARRRCSSLFTISEVDSLSRGIHCAIETARELKGGLFSGLKGVSCWKKKRGSCLARSGLVEWNVLLGTCLVLLEFGVWICATWSNMLQFCWSEQDSCVLLVS